MIRHDLPNGKAVFFDPEPHVYFDENGTELAGVTTVIRDIGGGPPAKYYERNAIEGLWELRRRYAWGGWPDCDPDDVLRWLEVEKLNSQAKFKDAGTTGTAVHNVFEAFGLGELSPMDILDGEDIVGADMARLARLATWWQENVESVLHSEIVTASHSLGYAGTVDFVGHIKGFDGPGILDLKTSNYVQQKYHFQLDGYRESYMESGYGETKWQAILHLPKEGEPRLVPNKAPAGAFRRQLAVYRDCKAISPPRKINRPSVPLESVAA